MEVRLSAIQKSELEKIQDIDKRGEFVAKIYLISKYGSKINFNCNKIPGADISSTLNGISTPFEVKATRDTCIALSKLKVSSQDSHDLIVGGATVLRVMEADTAQPTISELKHGIDFTLVPEKRWRAKSP